MSKNKTPAFPAVDIITGDNYNRPTQVYYTGISVRDYFAAKAMEGIVSNSDLTDMTNEKTAELAYEIASAMLIERNSKC